MKHAYLIALDNKLEVLASSKPPHLLFKHFMKAGIIPNKGPIEVKTINQADRVINEWRIKKIID